MTRRWIILGSAGQLGTWLVRRLEAAPGHEVAAAADLPELDVGDPGAVRRFLARAAAGGPAFAVNAAAFTDVDRCETEPEEAQRVNALAPGYVARACRDAGVRLAHVSTDYVFDGETRRPLREDDLPRPLSVYGRSKLAGERAVLECCPDFLVVRTSWVFGPGRNFIASVLAQAERARREPGAPALRVVDDQLGAPTYSHDLAGGIASLLSAGKRGLYHLRNAGEATWWDLARASLDLAGYPELEIERIRTEELELPAPRPRYSLLDVSRAERAGVVLRSWREALEAYLHSDDAPAAAGAPAAGARREGPE